MRLYERNRIGPFPVLYLEVHYKIQTLLGRVYTCYRLIRTKYVQFKEKIFFLWNPSVALDYCFSSLSQWSILPIFLDWSQDDLELQDKNELIARCNRKWMVPGNDYFIFISWLPEGSRFYTITAGFKLWPDLACVINWTMNGNIRFARLKSYFFSGASYCIIFWFGPPKNISWFLVNLRSIAWPGVISCAKPIKPSTIRFLL